MSEHDAKVIVVFSKLELPVQTYKNLETWINIDGRDTFMMETYSKQCDIFGFIPQSFDFANEKTIEIIVEIFKKNPTLKYIASQQNESLERVLFCKKSLVDEDNTGFSVDFKKEQDIISVKGLFTSDG
jgi:hypothetical protein